MDALKHALAEIVAKGSQLRAVIVDDDFESIGVPSFAEWITLRDALQEVPELHDDVLECLIALNHNPEEPPPIETLARGVKHLRIVPIGTQKDALDVYMRSDHVLQRLRWFLEDLGFTVACFATKPPFSREQLPFLCLVDYQILPEESSGTTASAIFEQLMQLAEEVRNPPPFVILMSKALSDDDIDKWTALAERAGFFRFNYGFLNKEQFTASQSHLAYELLHFVKHERLSRAYFLQMSSLVAEALCIAKKVSCRLFQVTPPEALLFKDRIFAEGTSLSLELANLFAELFSKEIKVSSNVVARMTDLEKVIAEEGVPVPHRQQRSALHRLYAELLHQECDPLYGEPSFGDIFEDNPGTYFLILSQECDLAAGEGRRRKTDRVVAIEGDLRNTPPSKSEGETIVAKPVFIAGNEQRMWLWWYLARPTVLSINCFSQTLTGGVIEEPFAPVRPSLKRRWRLRFADAEDIQHRFATRMTRVALNLMPDFIHVNKLRCSHDDQVIDATPAIFVYEVQRDKKVVALAPDSQASCCAIDNGRFMSTKLITKLSDYVSLETFNSELLREDLLVIAEGETLFLSKTTPEFRRGKKAWKGTP
jgi:hypothetical protein